MEYLGVIDEALDLVTRAYVDTFVATIKTSTTTGTAQADDAQLAINVQANAVYILEAMLQVSSPQRTNAFGYNFNGPAGATIRSGGVRGVSLSAVGNQQSTGFNEDQSVPPSLLGTPSSGGVSTSSPVADILGIVMTSSTAGSVVLHWGNETGSALATLYAGSYMSLSRIA